MGAPLRGGVGRGGRRSPGGRGHVAGAAGGASRRLAPVGAGGYWRGETYDSSTWILQIALG